MPGFASRFCSWGQSTTKVFCLRSGRDIAVMVYTPIGPSLERAAGRSGRDCTVHVCVDTGLGRVGVPHEQAFDLIRGLAAARRVRISGMMMTFTEDEAFDREQLRRFQALVTRLDEATDSGRREACGIVLHPVSAS